MTVLFALVKLAVVALHSGTIWVDGSSPPIFIFEAVNSALVFVSAELCHQVGFWRGAVTLGHQ